MQLKDISLFLIFNFEVYFTINNKKCQYKNTPSFNAQKKGFRVYCSSHARVVILAFGSSVIIM